MADQGFASPHTTCRLMKGGPSSSTMPLWRSVSLAELRAMKFIWAEGRACVVFAHTVAALGSTIWKSFPWHLRETLCCRCLFRKSFSSFNWLSWPLLCLRHLGQQQKLLVLLYRYGWNFTHCWFFSFFKLSQIAWFTPSSRDQCNQQIVIVNDPTSKMIRSTTNPFSSTSSTQRG